VERNPVMAALFITLLILLALSCVGIGVLIRIRRAVENIRLEQANLSIRMDALRRELKPAGSSLETAGSAPAAPAPKPASAPLAPSASAPRSVDIPPPLSAMPAAKAAASAHPAVAAPAKQAPAPASEMAETTRDILRKIWNWILVGEEHRIAGVSAEYAVASVWLLRLSIVAIVTGLVYFLKWSIERDLIGPAARVALSMAAGIGLTVGGMRLLGRKYHLIAQGLLGGGLLTMYFSSYAAGPWYRLFGERSVPASFALMILITVAAGLISVRSKSMLIAILGLIGGYLTPVMLRTDAPNLPGLYSYMLLLGLGVLAVAHFRQWRLLNYLSFLFTYALFVASMRVCRKEDFAVGMSFLSAFFAVQSSMVYVYNLRRRKQSTPLEILHLAANGAVFAAIGYSLIENAHGRPYPALMSLGLSVFYLAHVLEFVRRRLRDRALLTALIALSAATATWTLPLILEKESLTIALSLLGLMFLWLGARLGSRFLQNLGHLLYLAVFARLVFLDIPRNFPAGAPVPASMAEYLKSMSDRLVTFGSCIASVIAAFLVQRRRPTAEDSEAVLRANDTPAVMPAGVAASVFYWFGALFMFGFLHLEINRLFWFWEPARLPALTLLWCAMAGYFLWRYLAEDRYGAAVFAAMSAFLAGAIVKLFAVDLHAWGLCGGLYFDTAYRPMYACLRLLDFGVVLFLMFAAGWLFARRFTSHERSMAPVFGYGGLVLLFVYASLELNSFLHWHLPKFQTGGISVLWAVFAIGFVVGGIWRNTAPLRYAGLALFCVVVGKVFFKDLGQMPVIYRVIAFIVVGTLLLLGSFAYIKSSAKFVRPPDSGKEQP